MGAKAYLHCNIKPIVLSPCNSRPESDPDRVRVAAMENEAHRGKKKKNERKRITLN